VPALRRADGGSVVFTASMAGIVRMAGRRAYGMTKAALVNLARSSARDLGADKIRVNAVCPGPIETGLTEGMIETRSHIQGLFCPRDCVKALR
jgi:NAD(P)-dependent dehydrogenase (short-subunit alcohol dehydrogenase family)